MGFIEKLAGILWPPKCIFCGSMLEPGSPLHVCSECYLKISFTEERIIGGTGSAHSGCDGTVCPCEYTGIVKDSLIRFKFYGMPSYYRTYAGLISDRIRLFGGSGKYDMVMCVPLHRQKEYSRGYNQAYLISKALSKNLKLPERSRLLKRIKSTDAQSLLNRNERKMNVTDAFKVTAPEEVKGKSILLVDDIMTTGYTLDECSKMLKEAGAALVTAAVVASGRKY